MRSATEPDTGVAHDANEGAVEMPLTLTKKEFVVQDPFIPDLSWSRFRDLIVIDAKLQKKINDEILASSTVRLVARVIRHAPGFVLRLPGHNVHVVAGEYDANGGAIDVSAPDGPAGHAGTTGSLGYASAGGVSRPGGPGGAGHPGGPGGSAPGIKLICEHLHSARLLANGGAGGKGGAGGAGGAGGDGRAANKTGIDRVEGTDGGRGGAGSSGGAGGNGGQIHVTFVTADKPRNLQLEVKGGAAGAAGDGGSGGKGGKLGGSSGARGKVGRAGTRGAAGSTPIASQVNTDQYWSLVASTLGGRSHTWAAYRLETGVYFYRLPAPLPQAEPQAPAGVDFLQLAWREFAAVLRLEPANAAALKYQKQILNDQNVLGLPRLLDIIPDFPTYSLQYAMWADQVDGAFTNTGIGQMLAAANMQVAANLFEVYRKDIHDRAGVETFLLAAAQSAQKEAQNSLAYSVTRLNDLTHQIQAAEADMNNQSISIGALIGTVGEVAIAVAAVVAAAPTAGASLVALVPDLAALGATAWPLIAQEVFAPTAQELKDLKASYGRVDKDVKDVYGETKAVITMVNSLQKLLNGTTPDNSKYVSLLRQAVEISHEHMVAKLRIEQAEMLLAAHQTQLDNDLQLARTADQQMAALRADVKVLQDAGHTAIRSTQTYIDVLQGIAFRAQRSVEIYTLRNDEAAQVDFSSGYLHPDDEHNFADGEMDSVELIAKYSASWQGHLKPINLQSDYTAYFAGGGGFDLIGDALYLSFTDAEQVASFRETPELRFIIDIDDLPPDEFEAKIEAVHVAFVGATSSAPTVTCKVRHGGLYLSKKRGGTDVKMVLERHVSQDGASKAPLQIAGITPTTGAATVTAPATLSFWGRGVAGDWEVEVTEFEVSSKGVDFKRLKEIQVWIFYQAFVPNA
jgi:hypothetical protein